MHPPTRKKGNAVLNRGYTAQLAHDKSHVYHKKLVMIIRRNNLDPTLLKSIHKLVSGTACDHPRAKRAITARNRDNAA